MLVVSGVVGGQWWSIYTRMVESTVALVPTASLHHEVTTHRPFRHVIHVVVSSSGPPSSSAPEAWLSSSSAPSSSVEMAPSVRPSSHGLISPVVTIVSPALARWRPHHAWASAAVERWAVVVRRWRVVEARTAGRVVGWIAAIHGHLHVHVHVVHIVHAWTVAQQTRVDWRRSTLVLILSLLQGAQ